MEKLTPNVASIANRMEVQPSFLRYETKEKLWSIHRRTFVSDTDKTLMDVAAQNLLQRGFNQEEATQIIKQGLRGLEQYTQEAPPDLDVVYITEMVRDVWHHQPRLADDHSVRRLLLHYEPYGASSTLLQIIAEGIKSYHITGTQIIDIMKKGVAQLRRRLS